MNMTAADAIVVGRTICRLLGHVFHPSRCPIPPQYRRLPKRRRPRTIGNEKHGIFDCYEYTYYYVYVSDEVPSSDRLFELRIRIPLKPWQSPERMEKLVVDRADEIMAKKGINTASFEKKKRGFRRVGTTKSESGRYILLNKQTRECWPNEGWGYFER